MKRRIVSAVLVVCSVLCMGLYQGTFAWFKSESVDVNSITFTVADISIEVEYESPFKNSGTEDDKYLLPGDTILSNVKIVNYSDIISDIRVRAEISATNGDTDVYNANDFEINWSAGIGTKKIDGIDYYVYENVAANENNGSTKLPVLDNIVCKNSCGNSYSNADLNITLTFQAKQKDGVTWQEIGELNV